MGLEWDKLDREIEGETILEVGTTLRFIEPAEYTSDLRQRKSSIAGFSRTSISPLAL
jgi:hypothetical protein